MLNIRQLLRRMFRSTEHTHTLTIIKCSQFVEFLLLVVIDLAFIPFLSLIDIDLIVIFIYAPNIETVGVEDKFVAQHFDLVFRNSFRLINVFEMWIVSNCLFFYKYFLRICVGIS